MAVPEEVISGLLLITELLLFAIGLLLFVIRILLFITGLLLVILVLWSSIINSIPLSGQTAYIVAIVFTS